MSESNLLLFDVCGDSGTKQAVQMKDGEVRKHDLEDFKINKCYMLCLFKVMDVHGDEHAKILICYGTKFNQAVTLIKESNNLPAGLSGIEPEMVEEWLKERAEKSKGFIRERRNYIEELIESRGKLNCVKYKDDTYRIDVSVFKTNDSGKTFTLHIPDGWNLGIEIPTKNGQP